MVIYIINQILILQWAVFLCVFHPTKRKTLLFLFLSFSQMFLLSLFRLNIGYDFQMYVEGFYRMAVSSFSELSYFDWEIGFVLFTKLVAFFTKEHTVYLGIISAFCLGSVAWFIYKHSKIPWLSAILYINLYFFYLSMNFLRQAIAISITLFAWQYLKGRRFLPFAVIVGIAALFHSTALILIPVYFLVKIKPTLRLLLLYGYGLLFFFISSEGFIDLLTDFFHQEYKNSALLQGLSWAYLLLPLGVLAAGWVYKDFMINSDSDSQALIHFAVLTCFLMTLMARHAILERLSYYSYIYLLLFIPDVLIAFTNAMNNRRKALGKYDTAGLSKCNKRTFALSLLAALAATYVFHAYGMLEGVHGVFPYKTWLP